MDSSQIKFYLKSVNWKLRPVILKCHFGYREFDPIKEKLLYKPLVYDTGVKLGVDDWDSENNLPKNHKDFFQLQEIKTHLVSIFSLLKANREEITPSLLKDKLDEVLHLDKTPTEVVVLTDFIDNFILTSEKLVKKTKSQYVVLKNRIIRYQDKYNIILTTKNLNLDHYLQFQALCTEELNKINAVWGAMKNFKSLLNKIIRKFKDIKCFNPRKELARDEKVQFVVEDKPYLNFKQIKAIMDFEPQSERLQNVKLILLTLLFSGCRYSDVFKVQPDFIHQDEKLSFRYAHFISEKGDGEEIIVPFLKPLEEAFSMNEGNAPRPISNVKFNKYVKELCEMIGFTEMVQISFTDSKGKKRFEKKEFYKFVASHIGRRSFISNLIHYVPVPILCKITGHRMKDKEVVFQYNKVDLKTNATLFMKVIARLMDGDIFDDFPVDLI